jgi:hypothetical protein
MPTDAEFNDRIDAAFAMMHLPPDEFNLSNALLMARISTSDAKEAITEGRMDDAREIVNIIDFPQICAQVDEVRHKVLGTPRGKLHELVDSFDAQMAELRRVQASLSGATQSNAQSTAQP